MTENTEYPTITPRQLQGFLTEKGMEVPCDLCGKNEWAIPAAEGADNPLARMAIGDEYSRKYLPAFPIYCGNCGNIKLILSLPVERWVTKNG